MLALYRKYRPSKFQEVIGQDHITQTLINSLKMGKMQHAYLFCGPKGTGKTTMARIIAKAVNCSDLENLKKTGEPCLKCENCLEIQNNSLDIIEVDAASNRGIDEIRELRDSSRFTPTKLKFKVFIIDEVHMLTKEAFNALLKTLEEPPAHIIFILATTEDHKVPETIKSRCQKFDLKKISITNLVTSLKTISEKENIKIVDQALKLVAVNSNGSSRDALSLLGSLTVYGTEELSYDRVKDILGVTDQIILTKFFDFLIHKNVTSAIREINNLADSGANLNQFIIDLLDYSRKILLLKTNPELKNLSEFNFSEEQIVKMQKQAQEINQKFLLNFIDSILKRKNEISETPFPQLPLELAVIENLPTENILSEKKVDAPKSSAFSEKAELFRQPKIKTENTVVSEKTEFLEKNSVLPAKPIETNKPENLGPTKIYPANLNLADIQNKWQKIIAEIKKANFSLAGILNTMKLISLENSCLMLACQYSFHQEIINDMKNKALIDDAIFKITNSKIVSKLILTKDLPKELQESIKKEGEAKTKQKAENLYNAAVSAFGEEI